MNKKRFFSTLAFTMAIAIAAASFIPFSANAANALDGVSTRQNGVKASGDTTINTTIMTNYHAGTVYGVVGISTPATFNQAVSLTKEQIDAGGYPVLYVNDSQCGLLAKKAFNDAAVAVSGNLGAYIEILLFKYADNYNQLIGKAAVPVNITIGIPTSLLSSSREFGMIRLNSDSTTTLLRDLDADSKTITIATDQFSEFALVYAEKGSFDLYEASLAANTQNQGAAAQAAATAANDELDDVPKTGETSPIPYAIAVIVVAAAGIVLINKRYARS